MEPKEEEKSIEEDISIEEDLKQLKIIVSRIQSKIDKKISSLKELEENFDSNHKLIETFTKRKVKLDVGGKIFSISLNMLTKEEPSFFSAMFSGRFKLEKDEEDGSYFIDRNPAYFEIILDYLRTGKVRVNKLLPDELEELIEEAEFYQIQSLIKILKPQKYFVTKFDPTKSNGFLLSLNDTFAICNVSTWSIVLGDKCMSSDLWYWEFKAVAGSGHNDRFGILNEADLANLGKPLTTFGVYLINNPGYYVVCDPKFKPIKALASQVTTNDVIGFFLDFRNGVIKIYINGISAAEYLLPQGKYYAAFGTMNKNTKVQLIENPHFPSV